MVPPLEPSGELWVSLVPKCQKLLERVIAAPNTTRFEDACTLAECAGFVLKRQRGSHRYYQAPGEPQAMNFQEKNGKAKGYQVRQLLEFIERHDITFTPDE